MFRAKIRQTELSTPGAEDYFGGRISGAMFEEDSTFVSTLRALIDPRLPQGDSITFRIETNGMSLSSLKNNEDNGDTDYIFGSTMNDFNNEDTGNIYLFNFSSYSTEASDKFMSIARKSFANVYGKDWNLIEDVTALFKKTFDCICFINPVIKSTVIFVTDLNLRKYHYLQCAILGMLPWYFDREKGITKEEYDLIYSLREKEPDKYLNAISKIAEKYDFESSRLKNLLYGFESRYERMQLEISRSTIDADYHRINEMNETIRMLINEINEQNIRMMGLQASIDNKSDEDSELLNYFQRNKSLYLESADDSRITFSVKGILSYFDPPIVKRCLDNERSFVYSYCQQNNIGKKDMRRLMELVFIDQEVRIKFCSAYILELNGGVFGLRGHTFPPSFNGYMSNPHINNYTCMGSNAPIVNDLMQEGKYIEAIEQCIASSRSLAWGDMTVMNSFFREISESTQNYFILPDGTETNIRGALDWTVKNRMNNTEEKSEVVESNG